MAEPRGAARNARTAFTLVTVALVFFVGVILAHLLGVGGSYLTVITVVVAAFVVLALGRMLARRR